MRTNYTAFGFRIITVTVNVNAGSSTGTATVPSRAMIVGVYPNGKQDQFIKTIAISGSTLTITLNANATATNTYNVTLLV
jgi:hypothetical protein